VDGKKSQSLGKNPLPEKDRSFWSIEQRRAGHLDKKFPAHHARTENSGYRLKPKPPPTHKAEQLHMIITGRKSVSYPAMN